jgi:perosamine synthetase
MNSTPIVSVLVAAHNEEKFIGRAIRSLLNQSLDRDLYEIVVIDDASSDRTSYALNLFEGDIKIVKLKRNLGLAGALNEGIKNANGRYVVRVDGDDFVNTNYLLFMSEFLNQNKSVDAVACDYLLVDDQEEVLERKNCEIDPIGCGIMFRIDQLAEIGMYDIQFHMHEDSDLRMRFLEKYTIERLPFPLYRYRKHVGNMTNDIGKLNSFKEKLYKKQGNGSAECVSWSGRGHDYTSSEVSKVVEVMKTCNPVTQGTYQEKFEKDFNDYIGSKASFAVSSCTAALELAAVSCQLDKDDEVIIPAHTFAASAIPFGRTGAKIVWADIDPETWVVTKKTLEPLITRNTKAIVVVHLYGLSCHMSEIAELCKSNNIILIEDCAQAIGSAFEGRKVGSFGDFGCFSFHGAKNLTTLGEGGVLTVNNEKFIPVIPGLRHNGMCSYEGERPQYWKPAMGNVESDILGQWPYNFCLGEIQCALGTELLKRIDQISKEKHDRAMFIRGELSDIKALEFQKNPFKRNHVYHLLPARVNFTECKATRDDLIAILHDQYKVKCVVQYYPLYRYPLFVKEGFGEASCPNTDEFFDNMISFPFHHGLNENEINYMIHSIKEACSKLKEL